MCYNPPLVRDKPLGAPAFWKLVYFAEGAQAIILYNKFENYTVEALPNPYICPGPVS